MAKKPIKPKEYQKIPVSPEVYAKVRMIADLNDWGLGDQVAAWVKRDLPECNHKKQGVSIEYMNSDVTLGEFVKIGWYCPTCKRVYVATPPTPIDFATSPLSPTDLGDEEDAGEESVLCDGGGKA